MHVDVANLSDNFKISVNYITISRDIAFFCFVEARSSQRGNQAVFLSNLTSTHNRTLKPSVSPSSADISINSSNNICGLTVDWSSGEILNAVGLLQW